MTSRQAKGKKKKVRLGVVTASRMQKTIIVRVERVYRHPRYDKVIRAASRCYVHDEKGLAQPGDVVRIMECRPLSRLKRWRLIEVVKKGRGVAGPHAVEAEVRELQEEIRGAGEGESARQVEAPPEGAHRAAQS